MKPAQSMLEFLGTPIIALLLSTICAMLFLGLPGGFDIKEITNVMTNSLHSCGNVSGLSQLQLATITIAIASGGTAFSHVNDSGFWLSKSLFEVDEKTNLKTWTMMETIVGLVGVVGATIVWFIVS